MVRQLTTGACPEPVEGCFRGRSDFVDVDFPHVEEDIQPPRSDRRVVQLQHYLIRPGDCGLHVCDHTLHVSVDEGSGQFSTRTDGSPDLNRISRAFVGLIRPR